MFKGYLSTKEIDVVVKIISKVEYPDYEKRIEREKKGLKNNLTITHVINFEGKILFRDLKNSKKNGLGRPAYNFLANFGSFKIKSCFYIKEHIFIIFN
jgi:hypothetical protein